MASSQMDFGKCNASIIRAYQQGTGCWRGCDWPARFGKLRLNVQGLSSSQAGLIAAATSGDEGKEWRRAVHWLTRIEEDAHRAEQNAALAVYLAGRQRFREALERAADACQIEAKYHVTLVWQPLQDAVAACVGERPASNIPARSHSRSS